MIGVAGYKLQVCVYSRLQYRGFATMKPKDLKPPKTWQERTVLIHDRVWYVPERYSNYEAFLFPGWSDPALFGNANPIVVEYCSGNGSWIVGKALEQPGLNWLAVERRFDRVRKIWSKIQNHQLKNLVVLCGEAYTATRYYFPNDSIHDVYVNFPDPWPKNRHAKHRLIRPDFVQELWRVLLPSAPVNLVTDDADYSSLFIAEFQRHPGFASSYPLPYYLTERPGYGASFFDELWREKGRTIRYHRFQKWPIDSQL